MSDDGCSATYVQGYRKGQPCPYRATALVNLWGAKPFRVCGYHARAYHPSVVYLLSWSLETVRRWQRMNLDRLLAS